MGIVRFDHLTRVVSTLLSRRAITGALGLGAFALPGLAEAKKKRKKKKLKRNDFGCVNVGSKCRGKDSVCCSGFCQGKKPKKGKKDKSKCAAHNVLACPAGANGCQGAPIECGALNSGVCYQTTGQASFCGEILKVCFPCTKDVDCEPDFGPGAACLECSGDCPPPGAACAAAVPEVT